MKLTFLGAAGTVTGSKYLLTTKKHQFLVDCGLFQGLKQLRERNWKNLPVAPETIDAVFLTHAHIDHSGYIPRLIKNGFHGPVYCSEGSFELLKILLPDSGYLQEEEARYANRKGYSKHNPALPLYTRKEAEVALLNFEPIPFNKPVRINSDVTLTLSRAGHILGASCILLEAASRRIIFSGDVGRYHDLIMRPPEPVADADYLIIESTYGDRDHENEDVWQRLADIINEAARNNGTIVIPAFAVGRAQHILRIVHELREQQRIPNIKTFLDSPMAINSTELYAAYHDEHRLTAKECEESFGFAHLARTPEESRAVNHISPPKIIISASGMASGGRVLHHLTQYLPYENNVVVLVGFQAAGTRGRALLDGATEIKIFGDYYRVVAKVENITGLSAHADRAELVRFINESALKNPRVFVTHGEKNSAEAFAQLLRDTFHFRVDVPKDGDEIEL